MRWAVGIDIDAMLNPHLLFDVYYDSIYHLFKTGGTWQCKEISQYGFFSNLIAISDTIVHLLGYTIADSVRHIWKMNNIWLIEDIHKGSALDLAVDKDGYLHCVISDTGQILYGTNRPQTSVSEYASPVTGQNRGLALCRLPLKITHNSDREEEVSIVDVTGRLVNTFHLTANPSEILWYGQDQYNRKVSTGIYFLIFRDNCKISSRKFILIR